MHKEAKDCTSMKNKYMKELFNKFGNEEEIPETQTSSFTMDFIQKEGVLDYFEQCIDFDSEDANNQLYTITSLTTLDPTSKLAFMIISCIISIFGLVGNLTLFVIYVRKDRKVRFNSLMLLIISFEFFFIICEVVKVILKSSGSMEYKTVGKMVNFLSFWNFFSLYAKHWYAKKLAEQMISSKISRNSLE